jgi:two-component system cell cycle sensor histidine kinase/response regulator CckA
VNTSSELLPAPRLRGIATLVAAATIVLIALEISTWIIHGYALVWSIRVVRVSFELCFATLLSFTIVKKEKYFQSILCNKAKAREFREEQMRLAMDAAKIGCWHWNIVNDEQVWSDTCKALLGLPPEGEANFGVLIKSIHPDDRKNLWSAINRTIEEREDYVCEFRVLWPDGSMHWQAARGRAFYNDVGRATHMVGIVMDIAEQKEAETRLRLHAAALEAAIHAIVITDSTGTILWVNQAFTDLTGYGREESIGQNPRILKSGEHDRSFYNNLWSTIQSGHVWRGEVRNRKKDGSAYTEEMTITPFLAPSGEITHFIAIKQDATEKKNLEAQYRQAQKMEAVGRLAGGVAHDFNNILGVITGYSEISLDLLEPEHAVSKHLRKIKTAADRAASLTKQLLAFSRQQVVYPRTVDLNTIVKKMEDMLQRLVGADVSIRVKGATPLGSIKADVGQLEQVLMNLAMNARDAMANGGQITIETRNVELDDSYRREHEPIQPGPYVMLSVSDSGSGMDETTKARIFEPFYTTKEPGKGTGLGLSTVYGIVKQSGGFIWVYSELGKGTTFKLYFPCVSEIAEALNRSSEYFVPGGGSETILLVEDDEALRELTAVTLRDAGYTVWEASNARTALELGAIHGGSVHLLLSDIVIPETSGVHLFSLLRASAPDLKVILMSGYATETLARHSPIPPDVIFIEKPFTRDSLLSTIRMVLNKLKAD